jgi:GDPmannose 4,6-dehydratase
MWMMLQQKIPQDFVIATGKNSTLEEFVETAFTELNLDWRDHVSVDPQFFRPTDLNENRADPGKAHRILGWAAQSEMRDVVKKMVAAEHNRD